MKFYTFAASCLIMALCSKAQPQMIAGFETDADLKIVQPHNVKLTVTTAHATEGQRALRVDYGMVEWPNVTFQRATPWDWSHAGGLVLDISNPGTAPVQFGVRADDDVSADGIVHCRTGAGVIQPGATHSFIMSMHQDPMAFGMRALPPVKNMVSLGSNGSGPFNAAHIIAFQVFVHRPSPGTALVLDNIRLGGSVDLGGIIDRFGQYTGADWPGKVHSEADLTQNRDREAVELASDHTIAHRDRFGGWADGPQLPPRPAFRTAKLNGKWWLVDPDGHLFFSLGMDCITTSDSTMVTGRESMFTWLPSADDPLDQFLTPTSNVHMGPVKSGDAFDFYAANLERKYGPQYESQWRAESINRLKSWGFNTIGNWSNIRTEGNDRVPYVATLGTGGAHDTVSSGSDYWGQMPDPFDPRFAADVMRNAVHGAETIKDDPWLLGYFVDNELSWGGGPVEGGRYGLAYGALAKPLESHAKQAILAMLKRSYPDIAAFNKAWGADLPAWSALEAPYKASATPTEAAKRDMAAFVKQFALRYFQEVKQALNAVDPKHLYMGCRFAWKTPEAVAAAAEVCDVVSFNIYERELSAGEWGHLDSIGKPCIIGEFHCGALDRGMFHPGLVATGDQQDRAHTYEQYVRSVLARPAFVGCHWFQYVDEPTTGRYFDGENYNIGFVSITDTPYPEMVAAARAVHAGAYRDRSGSATAASK